MQLQHHGHDDGSGLTGDPRHQMGLLGSGFLGFEFVQLQYRGRDDGCGLTTDPAYLVGPPILCCNLWELGFDRVWCPKGLWWNGTFSAG